MYYSTAKNDTSIPINHKAHHMNFIKKIPPRREILPVYSLILFIVFSWSIFRILFQIPSWLYSHSKTGIVFLSAYVFSFDLIESTLVLFFVFLVCIIMPRYFLYDRFVAQGSILVLTCTAWALIIQFQRDYLHKRDLAELVVWIILFTLSLVLISSFSSYFLRKNESLQTAIEALADRMIVFGWLYISVGLISLVILLARNIFLV
jgi:hypothetical protein